MFFDLMKVGQKAIIRKRSVYRKSLKSYLMYKPKIKELPREKQLFVSFVYFLLNN